MFGGIRSVALASALLSCACVADVERPQGPDASVGAPLTRDGFQSFQVLAPLEGEIGVVDHIDAMGRLSATFALEILPGSYDRIVVRVDDTQIASVAAGQELGALDVALEGQHTLWFDGYLGGELRSTLTRDVQVRVPDGISCAETLDLYDLDWEEGAPSPGVESPIRLNLPLRGVNYRYAGSSTARRSLYMSCDLAVSIAKSNPSYISRGVSTVIDLGIYNYRCIGGEGSPPDCPRGMSEHASARALDLHAFELGDDLTFSVEDDWLIDDDEVETCDAIVGPGANQWLHELVCEQQREGIWNNVLTPNFNAVHRNHFHVDLSDDIFVRSLAR